MLPALPIPRIAPPSVDIFYRDYVLPNKPVVITGIADDWAAMKAWELKYFIEKYGDTKSSAYPLRDGQCDVMVNRGSPLENISVKETMMSIGKGNLNGGLTMASLIDKFPASLKEDYKVPIYCDKEEFLVSRLFIGPEGVLSPLHQDLAENLYVMVKGKKRLTLFSPDACVYPARFSKMPNHAHTDPEKPDFDKYPKFAEAQPYVVELSAGETLYLPSMWWHHLRNLEPSIALNFWWYRGWKWYFAKASSLYRKLKPS